MDVHIDQWSEEQDHDTFEEKKIKQRAEMKRYVHYSICRVTLFIIPFRKSPSKDNATPTKLVSYRCFSSIQNCNHYTYVLLS